LNGELLVSINSRVIELVAQWEELRAQGKSLTPEDLCANEPDLLPEVRRCLEQQQRFQALADTGPERGAAPTLAEDDLPQIEGYEVLELIGQGGMGVVYKARHVKLNRVVALKMILPSHRPEKDALLRFRTEAEAVARLQHPGIVQIFEIGEHRGLPFFSLEFCPGGSLAKKLGGKPAPPRQSAPMVEHLAEAMDAAHQGKVIHRDLKPANVLLAEKGQLKITDFGLAKKLDDTGLTQPGAVLGTPSYMAPEQAAGTASKIGPSTDVYALGAILYELLTGRPPFTAASVMDILLQVISRDPVAPSQLLPGVPKDLETICLKCLRKEPAARYASAKELATDLRRFLDGAPIRARPVGRLERTVKWVKRRPAVAGLLGALAAVIVVAFTVVLSALHETTQALDQADAERKNVVGEQKKTKKQLDKALAHLFTAQLRSVAAVWERDPDLGYSLLHDYEACPINLRDFVWGWYEGRCRRQPQRAPFEGHSSGVTSVAISPDGKTLASASLDLSIKLWHMASGKERATIKRPPASGAMAFSPDGKTLATFRDNGTIELWEVDSGKECAVLKGHTGQGLCVAFSPDGKTLASADRGINDKKGLRPGQVKLWDVATKKERTLLRGAGSTRSVAFSSDSNTLALADGFAINLWDVGTGKHRIALKCPTSQVHSVAFSPDGKTLASGHDRVHRVKAIPGEVKLWDVVTGQELASLKGHTHSVRWLAFSPHGKSLASWGDAYYNGWCIELKLWDVGTREERAARQVRVPAAFGFAACSFDGRTVTCAVSDRWENNYTIKVLDIATGKEGISSTRKGIHIAFSPDGKTLASWNENKLSLWHVITGQQCDAFKGPTSLVTCLAFSPDGSTLATANADAAIQLWAVDTGRQRAILKGHTARIDCVGFSPDGKTLVSASYKECEDGRLSTAIREARQGGSGKILGSKDEANTVPGVKLWDVVSAKERGSLKGRPNQWPLGLSVAFSPDGKTLALGGSGITLWDLATGQELVSLKGHSQEVTSIAFSPDGKSLASAGGGRLGGNGPIPGELKLWDVATRKERTSLKGHTDRVTSVAFSPDGKTLASSQGSVRTHETIPGEVKLWDVATGQERGSLKGHTQPVTSLAFSRDGRTLASGSMDSTIRLWEVATGPELATLKGAGYSLVFSPDGKTLASWSGVRVKLWDVATGQERPFGGNRPVAFSPDGKTLASGSLFDDTLPSGKSDNTVNLWDLASEQKGIPFKGHTDQVTSVAFSPDGKTIASAHLSHFGNQQRAQGRFGSFRAEIDWLRAQPPPTEKGIKLWDVATRTELTSFRGYGPLAFSPDGKTLASGSWDATIKLWDVGSHQELATLDSKGKFGVFSPDGRIFAYHTEDTEELTVLWDIGTRKPLRSLKGGGGCIAFSPDGTTLASGHKLWDVASGQERGSFLKSHLKGHTNYVISLYVSSVAFSPDGTTLASGSSDGTVRLWDVATGKNTATLLHGHTDRLGHIQGVWKVAFSPDGKTLASGSVGIVKLWDLSRIP
jgi:WD40 repeat protein/tRNA A-37 threonylcarbamoyl transferase component Bud32